MEPSARHPSGFYKFQAVPIFLEKFAHFCSEDAVMLPINFPTFPTSPQLVFFRQVRSLVSQEAANSRPRKFSLTDSSNVKMY